MAKYYAALVLLDNQLKKQKKTKANFSIFIIETTEAHLPDFY